jgi:hypothetical protein
MLTEWANLRFDASGAVIDPITGGSRRGLRLTEGRHREPGSRYAAIIETPSDELPEGPRTVLVVLNQDDDRLLGATVIDERQGWAADVEIHHGPLPHVDVTGRLDLAALLEDERTPGWLARLFGRTATGRAALDLAALDEHGATLLDADARTRRFRGRARLGVDSSITTWAVEGHLALRGRGLGRLVLLVAGSPIRRRVDAAMQGFWERSGQWVTQVEKDLVEVASLVEGEGGAGPFVRRALWDPHFDPRPPGAS